jgi:hypothetical protein
MKYVAAIIGAKVILPRHGLHPLRRFVPAPLTIAVFKKLHPSRSQIARFRNQGRAQCKSKVPRPRI